MSEQRPDRPDRVRVRRAPKLGVFIGLGVALGIIAALVLTSVFPVDEQVGFAGTFGYLAIWGAVLGLIVGAVVGLVLDAILSRRAREVGIEVEVVEAPEADAAEDAAPEGTASGEYPAESTDPGIGPDPDVAAEPIDPEPEPDEPAGPRP